MNRTGMALLIGAITAAGLTGCAEDEVAAPTTLAAATENEAAGAEEGESIELFDGASFEGWRGLGREDVPAEHWRIDDGLIHKLASGTVPVQADGQPIAGGDLMTEATFDHFEFTFEWKVAEGANSGVKYNVSEALSTANPPSRAALGFEYQVLDDERHPDGQKENHRSGALYDLVPPNEAKKLAPVGEWNESRIVLQGNNLEHWLNGAQVVKVDLASAELAAALGKSKYAPVEGFATRRAGHIVLQDHNDEVWFRNLKLRRLPGEALEK